MSVSRRDFLKIGGGVMAGTAVGALASLGTDLRPKVALAREFRIKDAKVYPSVCPYCAVGCGTRVHVVDGKIVNIEGNPDSPVSQGNLCPKGAAARRAASRGRRPARRSSAAMPNPRPRSLAPRSTTWCARSSRTRGGGRGADVGNRPKDSAEVEIHGKTNPSHDVPAVGQGIKKERGR